MRPDLPTTVMVSRGPVREVFEIGPGQPVPQDCVLYCQNDGTYSWNVGPAHALYKGDDKPKERECQRSA
jgi:hypothetical protein